jgi:hypothetical protein
LLGIVGTDRTTGLTSLQPSRGLATASQDTTAWLWDTNVDSVAARICDITPTITDKMLALWGRARPRDFFDVAALIDRYGHERLLGLAEAKDSGFTHETFIDALRAIAHLGDADWAEDGISSDDAKRLRTTLAAAPEDPAAPRLIERPRIAYPASAASSCFRVGWAIDASLPT